MSRSIAYFLALMAILAGCQPSDNRSEAKININEEAPKTKLPPPPPPPPDQGDIGHFLACKAQPRREISERESCQLSKLRSRCTPADDCLVSCITSPKGYKEGGGCEHVCFYGPFSPEPKPPGWSDCDRKNGATISPPD